MACVYAYYIVCFSARDLSLNFFHHFIFLPPRVVNNALAYYNVYMHYSFLGEAIYDCSDRLPVFFFFFIF